jgi:hypothetical protein
VITVPGEYKPVSEPELVLWDVGLGAATNAMAAIHVLEEAAVAGGKSALRGVRIVSFENDLDSLRLATSHAALKPWYKNPSTPNDRWALSNSSDALVIFHPPLGNRKRGTQDNRPPGLRIPVPGAQQELRTPPMG